MRDEFLREALSVGVAHLLSKYLPGEFDCEVGGLPAEGVPCATLLLRHGCGFKLVNQGTDTRSLAAYLGHRNMQNTARYTKMSAKRFDGLWRD